LGAKYGYDENGKMTSLALRVENPVMKLMMLLLQKVLKETTVERVFDRIRDILFGVKGSEGFLDAVKASREGREKVSRTTSSGETIQVERVLYFFNEVAIEQLCKQASGLMGAGIGVAEVFTQVREEHIDMKNGLKVTNNGEEYVLEFTGHIQIMFLEKFNFAKIKQMKVNQWVLIGYRNWRDFETLEGIGLGIMKVAEGLFVFMNIYVDWSSGFPVLKAGLTYHRGYGGIGELRFHKYPAESNK
jgi:hypothetical protein